MRAFLFIAAFLVLGSTAHARTCEEFSMQFFGTVRTIDEILISEAGKPDRKECVFQVSIDRFQEDPECPAEVADAYNHQFEDPNCVLTLGQEISGTIIQKGNRTWMR